MLSLKEKIHNLETILSQNTISLKTRQILSQEIKRLQELVKQNE